MLQSNPTKKGTGIEIWGDALDLRSLHSTIHKIADNVSEEIPETKAQALILLGFAYEVRKAEEGFRLHKTINPGPEQKCDYVGLQYLWVDVIMVISVLRYNAGFVILHEQDQANLFMLTHAIRTAMEHYDAEGAKRLTKYLKGGISSWDPMLILMLQGINFEYLSQKPGKTRFRKLADLIKGYTSHYEETHKLWKKELDKNAKKFNCSIFDLDYEEYPEFEW